MELFVGVIDTKLFETVDLENFETVDIQYTDEIFFFSRAFERFVELRDNPVEQVVVNGLINEKSTKQVCTLASASLFSIACEAVNGTL